MKTINREKRKTEHRNSSQYSKYLPGWVANSQISSTEVRLLSPGAWSTINVDPTIHKTQPSIPIFCSFSFKKKCARTALPKNQTTKSKSQSSSIETKGCIWLQENETIEQKQKPKSNSKKCLVITSIQTGLTLD